MAKGGDLWRNDAWDEDVGGEPREGPVQQQIENDEIDRLCAGINADTPSSEIEVRVHELYAAKLVIDDNLARITSQLELRRPLSEWDSEGKDWAERAGRYRNVLVNQERKLFGMQKYVERVLRVRRASKYEGEAGMKSARRDYVYFALRFCNDDLFAMLNKQAIELIPDSGPPEAWQMVISEISSGPPAKREEVDAHEG